MKKVLTLFGGTAFSEGVVEFAHKLNELHPIILEGVFMPQISYIALMTSPPLGGVEFIPLLEVDSLLATRDANVDSINLLLDNADYQIHFAEALGHRKKDKEYKELHDAIKNLRRR